MLLLVSYRVTLNCTGLWLSLLSLMTVHCYANAVLLSLVDVFRRETSNHNQIPRTTQAMVDVITEAMMKARKVPVNVSTVVLV